MQRFRALIVLAAAILVVGAVGVRAQAAPAAGDATKGKTITLHLQDALAEEIFKQISQQVGTPLEPASTSMWRSNNLTARHNIDIDNKPFWEAMQTVAEKTGVRLVEWGNEMRLDQSTSPRGVEMISGPCMFVLQSASYNRSAQLGDDERRSTNFNVSMAALLEPGMPPSGTPRLTLEEATDDNGNSLIQDAQSNISTSMSGSAVRINLPLTYPQNPGKRFARLKGTLHVGVQTKSQTVEIPDILAAKNVTKTVKTNMGSEIKVTVESVQTEDSQYTVKVVVQGAPLNYSSLMALLRTMELRDADGTVIRRSGWGGGGSDGRIEGTVNFERPNVNQPAGQLIEAPPGAPAKLVWDIPTDIEQIEIPFEFTDLPMP